MGVGRAAAVAQWTDNPCGSQYADSDVGTPAWFESTARFRYQDYAPWLPAWADFAGARGQRVLEVGCGIGSDLTSFAMSRADVAAVDVTPRSLELTGQRLAHYGFTGDLQLASGEHLPFSDASFDRVYSFGVLHHIEDPAATLREMVRVLKPGGRLQIAVYHRRSAFYWAFLWLYHGVVQGELRRRPMREILALQVEKGASAGDLIVRVHTRAELRDMLRGLERVRVSVRGLNPDDLPWLPGILRRLPMLRSPVGALLRALGRVWGWYVCADAIKPAA